MTRALLAIPMDTSLILSTVNKPTVFEQFIKQFHEQLLYNLIKVFHIHCKYNTVNAFKYTTIV